MLDVEVFCKAARVSKYRGFALTFFDWSLTMLPAFFGRLSLGLFRIPLRASGKRLGASGCLPYLFTSAGANMIFQPVRLAHREGMNQPAIRHVVATSRTSGFTLIELMVVIGIIAVLLSILMPVMGKVRDQARMTQCASNLRNIGQAASVYLNMNDHYFPPAKNQDLLLDPADPTKTKYISLTDANAYWGTFFGRAAKLPPAVFKCPSNQQKMDVGTGLYTNDQVAYGFNGWGNGASGMSDSERITYFGTISEIALFRSVNTSSANKWGNWNDQVGRSLAAIKTPSKTILAQDAWEALMDGGHNGDTFASVDASNRGKLTEYPGHDIEYLRHMNAANVVFVDGHIERLGADEQKDERYYTGNWAAPRSY